MRLLQMICMSYGTVFLTCVSRCHKLTRVLLVGLSFAVFGEAQTPASGVQLTATVLSQHDCRTDAEYHSLFLEVRLQLMNNTGSSVEVPFPMGGVVIISRTLADAGAGRHEFELHGAESPGHPVPATAPQVRRRSVPPGKSIESVSNVQLLPAREGDKDGLKPGRHYLQIQVGASFTNPEVAGKPSTYQRITSAAAPFDVERYPVPVDCSATIRDNR